jgi:hypothetical protein
MTITGHGRRAFLGLLTAVLFGGCASAPDRVIRVYQNSEYTGGPFSNVLVIGIAANADNRRLFERGVAQAISAEGTRAQSSLTVMRSSDPISRESVLAAADSAGADAVLITRIIDSAIRAEVEEGKSSIDVLRRNQIPMIDFFRYYYTEYQDPMDVTTIQSVVLATELYDVANEARIWGVESTSMDKTTVFETVDGAARGLSNALRRDGLIR